MKRLIATLFIILGAGALAQGNSIDRIKDEFKGYKETQRGEVLYLENNDEGTMAFIGNGNFKLGNLKNLLNEKGFSEEKPGYYRNSVGQIGYLGSEDGVKYLLLSEDGIGLADMREKMYNAFFKEEEKAPLEEEVPVPVPEIKKERYHTVVKGDTLYNISKRFGLTVEELQKLNNLKNNNIKLGQVLKY